MSHKPRIHHSQENKRDPLIKSNKPPVSKKETTEPMGIDDLIKHFTSLMERFGKIASYTERGAGIAEGCKETYEQVIKHITKHRPALEAGMKPQVLRFKEVNMGIARNMILTFYEYEYGTTDKPNRVRFNTQGECSQFAKNLKCQAEFIEEES